MWGPGVIWGHQAMGGQIWPGPWGSDDARSPYGREVGARRGGRWDRERRERDWEEDELRGGRR